MAEKRIIKTYLNEEERSCSCCKINLTGKSGMIYIIAPGADLVYEYCSWKCMFTHAKKILTQSVETQKILSADLLDKMGYHRIWDDTVTPDITQEDLTKKLDDPR